MLVSNRPFGQFLAMRAMPPKVELAEPSQTIPTCFSRNVLTAIGWTGLPSNRFRERLTKIHQPHVPKFAHTILFGDVGGKEDRTQNRESETKLGPLLAC